MLTNLPYNNEYTIKSKHIFGHIRKNESKLISTISVKELCTKNKNALAAGIIYNGVTDILSLNNDIEDIYIRQSAHTYALLDDRETLNSLHNGDCVKMPMSCITCICEDIYTTGLCELSYFEELINFQQDDKIINKLSKFDTCILYMTVHQYGEYYWHNYQTSNIELLSDYDYLLQFLSLSDDEQYVKYNRMKKIREYIENPIIIEGIPWW